jgi:hypothetical protein
VCQTKHLVMEEEMRLQQLSKPIRTLFESATRHD